MSQMNPPNLILAFFLMILTFLSEDFVQMKLEPLNNLVSDNFLVISVGLPLAALALSYCPLVLSG